MLPVFLAATLAPQASPAKVTFQDGAFMVSGALGSEIVPIEVPTAKDDPVDRKRGMFRTTVAGKTVTFDAKGLTVTQKRAVTSRLSSVPTSGKLATKESNAELMRLVAEGKRKLEVSALSGWELVGDDLYLLFRWDDSSKKPWLEALMKMDMSQPKPEPRLVGRFGCLSFAQGIVDDVMVQREDEFLVVGNSPKGFVLSRIGRSGSNRDDLLGQAVSKAKFLPDASTAWALTSTPYGTNILGFVDISKPVLRTVSEFRGRMRGVLPPAYAQFDGPDGLQMVNLASGAVTALPKGSRQQPTANGLLVWWPATGPTKAVLYDASFRTLTAWAGSTAPAVAPKAESAKPPAAKVADKRAKLIPKGGRNAQPAKGVKAKPGAATRAAARPKSTAKKPTKPKVDKPKIEVSSKPSGRG